MSEPLLAIDNLKTWFPIKRGLFSRVTGHVKAVDGISLTIGARETVGLVGESGCGKTTLGRTILGLEQATAGSIHFGGQDLLALKGGEWRPIRRRLQMIFQDPYSSLNPRQTVLDIVTEGLVAHGLLKGDRQDAARALLREVGLDGNQMHRFPHEFSGGQRQRIGIARALSLQPEFIVCDEAVSALDVSVQAQVINLLMDLSEKRDLGYLFISHDLSVVRHISHRVAVMYLGRIVEYGTTRQVIDDPKHPYTEALISAVPVPGEDQRERIVLGGDVPSPANPPRGCPFHPRCPQVMDVCRANPPPRMRQAAGRETACHLYPETGGQGQPPPA